MPDLRLKGNYHENFTFWNKWHTWTYKQDKIYGEPILNKFWLIVAKKWTWIIFTIRHKTHSMTHLRCRLVSMTSSVQRAAENNMGRIGFWSISKMILIKYYVGVLWNRIFQSPGHSGNHPAPSAKILKAAGHLQSSIMHAEQAPINRLIPTLCVRFMPRQSALL